MTETIAVVVDGKGYSEAVSPEGAAAEGLHAFRSIYPRRHRTCVPRTRPMSIFAWAISNLLSSVMSGTVEENLPLTTIVMYTCLRQISRIR